MPSSPPSPTVTVYVPGARGILVPYKTRPAPPPAPESAPPDPPPPITRTSAFDTDPESITKLPDAANLCIVLLPFVYITPPEASKLPSLPPPAETPKPKPPRPLLIPVKTGFSFTKKS